jgi:hypothetical protein
VLNGSFVMTIPARKVTAYTGGVNDDITQNAIPIATNTILIILLSPFGSFCGEYPGLVPGLHTHILHGNR